MWQTHFKEISGKKEASCAKRMRLHINRQQPIFPGRRQPSIVGTRELNFCVRNGNRCGLAVITTGMVEGLYPQDCIRAKKKTYVFCV